MQIGSLRNAIESALISRSCVRAGPVLTLAALYIPYHFLMSDIPQPHNLSPLGDRSSRHLVLPPKLQFLYMSCMPAIKAGRAHAALQPTLPSYISPSDLPNSLTFNLSPPFEFFI